MSALFINEIVELQLRIRYLDFKKLDLAPPYSLVYFFFNQHISNGR